MTKGRTLSSLYFYFFQRLETYAGAQDQDHPLKKLCLGVVEALK